MDGRMDGAAQTHALTNVAFRPVVSVRLSASLTDSYYNDDLTAPAMHIDSCSCTDNIPQVLLLQTLTDLM